MITQVPANRLQRTCGPASSWFAGLVSARRLAETSRRLKDGNVKSLVMIIGLLIAAMGILRIAAPSVPFEFARSLPTPSALYIVAGVRVCFGLLLVWVAPGSRAPIVLRILGVLIVIAGVITPYFGVERSRAVLDWWSSQGAAFMRVGMGFAVAFGLAIVYAVAPRRPAAA
jgi:hypothetical protein